MVFGIVKKAVKSATKAVSDTVKTAAKVTSKVFSSKVFNIATTAMCFVPGLNAAGLIGKAASILGKASTTQNWIKSGISVFNALKSGKGINDAVMNLLSGKFQPLGPLSKLCGPFGSKGGLLGLTKNAAEQINAKANLLKLLQPLMSNQTELMKPFLPHLSEFIKSCEGLKSPFVKNVADFSGRIQSAAEMLHEMQKLLTPHPLLSRDYVVQC